MSKIKNRITALYDPAADADSFRESPLVSSSLKFVTSCETHSDDYESAQAQESIENWLSLTGAITAPGVIFGQTPVEQRVAELTERVQYLESIVLQWRNSASDLLARLVNITTDIFGQNAAVYESYDPEYPDEKYIVFKILSDLGPEDVIKARAKWNAALFEIAPGCDSFRLLVYPK